MMSVQARFVEFSILILFGIPSIICTIYFIYHLIKMPSFRKRFQNQTLIILVFIVFVFTIFNLPTIFSYYATGHVILKSENFCYIWQCIDCVFTACIIWCKAIYTLERYILVFNPYLIRSNRQRLIFHHIPLILINLYLVIFYSLATALYECPGELDYNEVLCGTQCLDLVGGLSNFNWLFNMLFPVFVIIFGSIIILIRVLWTRRAMQRNLRNWSKNWKMITQLLGIAIFYTIIWLPIAIIRLIKISDKDNFYIGKVEGHLYFITYLCQFTVPIVAIFLSPEILPKLHRHFQPTTTKVGPITNVPHSTH